MVGWPRSMVCPLEAGRRVGDSHTGLPLERFTFPMIFNAQLYQVLMSSRSLAKWVDIISLTGGTEAPFETLESFER